MHTAELDYRGPFSITLAAGVDLEERKIAHLTTVSNRRIVAGDGLRVCRSIGTFKFRVPKGEFSLKDQDIVTICDDKEKPLWTNPLVAIQTRQ